MTATHVVRTDPWTAAGRQAAQRLAPYHAVAILAEDPGVGARVARGVADVLAHRRRVILADLVGDTPGLRELSTVADPEGISDSFDFGISLRRVARVTPIHNVSLIPSGNDPVERSEVFRSGRWERFARDCRSSGALLLVLARPSAPGVNALVQQLDGAAAVGGAPVETGQFPVIARVEPPPDTPAARRRRSVRTPVLVAAVALVIIVSLGVAMAWIAYSRASEGPLIPVGPTVDTPLEDVRGGPALGGLLPANPSDSLQAATFAVEIMSANTREGATFELQRQRAMLPAVTFSPSQVGGTGAVWYRLYAGAYEEARQADSLLQVVRAGGMVAGSAGSAVRVPLALLIDSTARALGQLLAEQHVGRGVPAYALHQSDGRALIYAGAFARPEESVLLADELRAAGLQPLLVYRTGGTF